MDEPQITYDELMREVARMSRPPPLTEFTDKQKAFILAARANRLTWAEIANLWNKAGWGRYSADYLMKRWSEYPYKDD